MNEKQSPILLRDSYTQGSVKRACGITLDIGRQRLTEKKLQQLLAFAQGNGVLTSGDDYSVRLNHEETQSVTDLCCFAENVRNGIYCGCRGDLITDVICVGDEDSTLGARAVWHALRSAQPNLRLYFLTEVDGVLFDRLVGGLNPFKTLVIVFATGRDTKKTLVNVATVDQWLLDARISGEDRLHHMVVVSNRGEVAEQLNLPEKNQFPLWSVGFTSPWSSMVLPCAVGLGPEMFHQLMAGTRAVDTHVAEARPEDNLPLLLAVLDYYNTQSGRLAGGFCSCDERLHGVAEWMQQLKKGARDKVDVQSDGAVSSSLDLCWCEKPGHRHADLHRVLIANARAQADVLVATNSCNAVSTLAIDELSPLRLGSLMALYERKAAMLEALLAVNGDGDASRSYVNS